MASYSISFKPSVEKDLRPLPAALIARVMKDIESLKDNPFPGRQSSCRVLNGCIGFG